MKKLIFGGLLAVFMLSTAFAQRGTERTGYDGDYFSLEGALDLFKQSYTLRDFERKLNTESNWVNNLDLNYDGRTDYIRVEHRRQGDFHAIILQAVVDRHDVQDVAVIEIDVIGRREAILQIIGDEDLYGEEVIVEPIEGYTDSRSGYQSDNDDYVNVYYWTPVQYILGRQYTVYASPYRWQYYPTWWSPWRPCAWNVFRPRIVIYTRYFTVVHRHRVVRVHNFYRNYRSYSYNVVQRSNQVRVKQGKAPIYRSAPVVQQDTNPSDNRSRNDVEARSRATNRSSSAIESSADSRKRSTQASDNQYPTRSSTPSVDQRSRSAEASPGRSRSNAPAQQPEVRSRNTTPAASQKATPPKDQRYRSAEDSPARSRSNTPARQPEVRSRNTTPSANQQARSSSPEVKQPSRSAASSSSARTATRSTSPSPKSSASSRSASASKSQATRSMPSKSSSSTKSESRSRKGGND
ncbi:MAG: hypothetical protein R2828_07675 [Saprospiraceae bacterium]